MDPELSGRKPVLKAHRDQVPESLAGELKQSMVFDTEHEDDNFFSIVGEHEQRNPQDDDFFSFVGDHDLRSASTSAYLFESARDLSPASTCSSACPAGADSGGSLTAATTPSIATPSPRRTVSFDLEPSYISSSWVETEAREHDLRLEVLGASELTLPEYRFGDYTKRFARGVSSSFSRGGSPDALLTNVYVELELGARTQKTRRMTSTGGRREVGFTDERFIFNYCGEPWLRLKVLDQRRLGAVLRGDPLIGAADLHLGEARDGRLRETVLSLTRPEFHQSSGTYKITGQVRLRYRVQEAPLAQDLFASGAFFPH